MLEAVEIRRVIDGARSSDEGDGPTRHQCRGWAIRSCAALTVENLDLDGGWLNYPRPKTGVARRCLLWGETVQALRVVIAGRTREGEGHVFLNDRGTPMISVSEQNHTDLVSPRFSALLKKLKLARPALGFYGLRHSFRTAADSARDPVAIDIIMGHTDPSMGAVYRERIEDDRLEAVVKVVRDWLWPDKFTVPDGGK